MIYNLIDKKNETQSLVQSYFEKAILYYNWIYISKVEDMSKEIKFSKVQFLDA